MKIPVFDQLTRAIDAHRVVAITDEVGTRVVEPYLLFESSGGDMLLHGWQRSGAFRTTPPPHWCNLHLDDIHSVELLAAQFAKPHAQYTPGGTNFHRVVYKLNDRGPESSASVAKSRLHPKRRGPPANRAGESDPRLRGRP